MTELMGSLRPIKQRKNATSPGDVDVIGNITHSVRYRVHEDLGRIEFLDQVELPYVPDAQGFALFGEAGDVLAAVPLVAGARNCELTLGQGWGIPTSWAGTDVVTPALTAAARG